MGEATLPLLCLLGWCCSSKYVGRAGDVGESVGDEMQVKRSMLESLIASV